MIEVQLNQGSPEWHKFRSEKIGASMAPAILNLSPYQSAVDLWEEMVGLKQPKEATERMKRGLVLEDDARKYLFNETGLEMFPVVGVHDTISYMSASFDGMTLDRKNAAEIKCNSKSIHEQVKKGFIPESHLIQMGHQMEVCSLNMIYYLSFDGVKGIIIKVQRSDRLISEILKKEEQFWYCLQSFIRPDVFISEYVAI